MFGKVTVEPLLTAKDVLQVVRTALEEMSYAEAARLWSLLTSLRGPDSEDERLKEATTARLRDAIVGKTAAFRVGATVLPWEGGEAVREALQEEYQGESHHFANHVSSAVRHIGAMGVVE